MFLVRAEYLRGQLAAITSPQTNPLPTNTTTTTPTAMPPQRREFGFIKPKCGSYIGLLQAHFLDAGDAVQTMGLAVAIDENHLVALVVLCWREPGLLEFIQPRGGGKLRCRRP